MWVVVVLPCLPWLYIPICMLLYCQYFISNSGAVLHQDVSIIIDTDLVYIEIG